MDDRHYELLKEIRESQKTQGTEITTLSTQMHSLLGNGQPGRLSAVEAEVRQHGNTLNWIKGVGSGALGLFGFLQWLFQHKK